MTSNPESHKLKHNLPEMHSIYSLNAKKEQKGAPYLPQYKAQKFSEK
jgi:hypothetical protein